MAFAGGEDVLNVLDAARLNDHRARLTAADASLDGGVSIASSEDTYLAGGYFDIDRMVDFVGAHLERAAANKRYVRTAGWMDWLHREAPGSERAIEYEARVNLLVPRFDCTFMCVYDLSALGGAMVADIMATHPYVVLKGRVRENPFYIPPEVYLREMLSTPARSA